VDHSVPGATAFLIEDSCGKKIAYTGDFRFHGARSDLTMKFMNLLSEEEPDVLITEGTRIEEMIKDDELEVYKKISQRVQNTKGLFMVGFAWKDVTRYLTLKKVAEDNNKILVISSKLAYTINKLKHLKRLYLNPIETEENVKVYLRRRDKLMYSKADYTKTKYDLGYHVRWKKSMSDPDYTIHYSNSVTAVDIRKNPSKYILHLDFYEFNELIDLDPPKDSYYVKAASEPFDEEMIIDEKRLQNWLEKFNLNPPKNEPIYEHASGHASGPEILDFVKKVNPKKVIPVHTQNPEIFKSNLSNVKLVKKGERVEV
jgi:ribonuclease J